MTGQTDTAATLAAAVHHLADVCVRAMALGLPVAFDGAVYSDPGELEDAIVASGRMVYVARADARGVEIGCQGWEQ